MRISAPASQLGQSILFLSPVLPGFVARSTLPGLVDGGWVALCTRRGGRSGHALREDDGASEDLAGLA